jgi:hypothetical protein
MSVVGLNGVRSVDRTVPVSQNEVRFRTSSGGKTLHRADCTHMPRSNSVWRKATDRNWTLSDAVYWVATHRYMRWCIYCVPTPEEMYQISSELPQSNYVGYCGNRR